MLAVASIATLCASVSSASADIGDTDAAGATVAPGAAKPAEGGYIRVLPTARTTPPGVDFENQVAPVLLPGDQGAKGASLQLAIPNDFTAGDRILVNVFPDGINNGVVDARELAGTAGNGDNCVSNTKYVGYASTPTLAVGGPYASLGKTWNSDGVTNNPGEDVNFGVNDADPLVPSVPTPGTTPVPPTATVTLDSSTQCAANGISDRIVVTINNQAFRNPGVPLDPTNDDYYVLTLTGITYNVGSQTAPGPIHNVPFAQQGLANQSYQDVPLFGGNDSQDYNDLSSTAIDPVNQVPGDVAGIDANMWTNGAFIAPVNVQAAGTSLVADGTVQPIGTITLTETSPDGLQSDPALYHIDVLTDGVCSLNLATAPTVSVTNNFSVSVVNNVVVTTVATGIATLTGGCGFDLQLNGMNDTQAGVVTLSGLTGSTFAQGTLTVSITNLDPTLSPARYLLPDDQTQGGSTIYSDVNAENLITKPFTTATPVPSRLGGQDRYETSAKIATVEAPCSEWAVIASGVNFPDALSANYLAGAISHINGGFESRTVPVLLTEPGVVPQTILNYLRTAGVKHIVLVGGADAVSSSVEATLASTLATRCTFSGPGDSSQPVFGQTLALQRFSGADRYATNRAVVNAAVSEFGGDPSFIHAKFLSPAKRTAIVATGTNFADALAAGPIAYDGVPLVLTDGTTLSADAISTLTANDITQVLLVGGTSAVSAAVETAIQGLGITTIRLAGDDRFGTAAAIADFMRAPAPLAASTTGLPYDGGLGIVSFSAILANGYNFPDALSAGPLAAVSGQPLLLTDATTLSANTKAWFVAHKDELSSLLVLGLGAAVSTAVLNEAALAIT